MVRETIAGRKMQTRRVAKLPPDATHVRGASGAEAPRQAFVALFREPGGDEAGGTVLHCPYGVPGDRLWVREAWRTSVACDDRPGSDMEKPGRGYGWPVWYAVDDGAVTWRGSTEGGPGFTTPGRYRHARFMPRWASRLLLDVLEVRVERLQAISEENARAEGVTPLECIGADQPIPGDVLGRTQGSHPHVLAFAVLWDSINGSRPGCSWTDNPWVWVVRFKRVEG